MDRPAIVDDNFEIDPLLNLDNYEVPDTLIYFTFGGCRLFPKHLLKLQLRNNKSNIVGAALPRLL
jgi:hypothetical protein